MIEKGKDLQETKNPLKEVDLTPYIFQLFLDVIFQEVKREEKLKEFAKEMRGWIGDIVDARHIEKIGDYVFLKKVILENKNKPLPTVLKVIVEDQSG